MRKLLFIYLVLLSTTVLKAQYYPREDTVKLKNTLFSLDVFTPGFSFETTLTKNKSLYLSAATGFAYVSETSRGQTETSYVIVPVLVAEYRKFYNLERRARQGKKTWFNTGNYFAFHVAYQREPIAGKNIDQIQVEEGFVLGPVWGIQRNGTLTFGLQLGLGIFTADSAVLQPIFDIGVGLNLSKLGQ